MDGTIGGLTAREKLAGALLGGGATAGGGLGGRWAIEDRRAFCSRMVERNRPKGVKKGPWAKKKEGRE